MAACSARIGRARELSNCQLCASHASRSSYLVTVFGHRRAVRDDALLPSLERPSVSDTVDKDTVPVSSVYRSLSGELWRLMPHRQGPRLLAPGSPPGQSVPL